MSKDPDVDGEQVVSQQIPDTKPCTCSDKPLVAGGLKRHNVGCPAKPPADPHSDGKTCERCREKHDPRNTCRDGYYANVDDCPTCHNYPKYRVDCRNCHGSGKVASERLYTDTNGIQERGDSYTATPEAQGADRCKLCGDWVNLRNHGIGVCSQPPTEAVTADGLEEILQDFWPTHSPLLDWKLEQAHAAIEAWADAKFERALGGTYESQGVVPDAETDAHDAAILEAQARWYKGEHE